MSERSALMRHIIEHPEDGARLVMADWLDEHGELDRAEFVRLQVSLAQEDVADTDEPPPTLRRRRATTRRPPRNGSTEPSTCMKPPP